MCAILLELRVGNGNVDCPWQRGEAGRCFNFGQEWWMKLDSEEFCVIGEEHRELEAVLQTAAAATYHNLAATAEHKLKLYANSTCNLFPSHSNQFIHFFFSIILNDKTV